MTVLCANCHTANRDRAMFCIGCAGKLPAFAATGPSALDTMRAPLATAAAPARPRARATPAEGRGDAHTPPAPRGLVLAVLLLGATVLALAAWISFGPERAATPGMASAAAPPLQTLPATPVVPPPAVSPAPSTTPAATAASAMPKGRGDTAAARANDARPPTPVPADATLSPGESMVPAAAAPPRPAPTSQAPERVASIQTARAAPRGASDPRAGCEHLFFVLAAHCEASHCEQAAYSRHPRCTLVREQRRRDEARRNFTN